MTAPSSPQLILASTSPYRRALLQRLGVEFEAIAPAVDEEALKDPALGAKAMAEALAAAKARSLQDRFPAATIIGSDQVCACEGQILNKPGDFAGACAQLMQLAGKAHQLLTAVCVVHQGHEHRFTDVTTLQMRTLTPHEIERYLRADQPYDCVGSYKLEERGIALFDAIDSADHTAITGLPLIALAKVLRDCGHAAP